MLILLGYDQYRPGRGLPFREAVQFLPKATGTIRLITLMIWFVNLEILGVCFLQGVRQESCMELIKGQTQHVEKRKAEPIDSTFDKSVVK